MSIKLGYPINKSQRFLQFVTFWIWTRTEMTVLKVIEKRQKSPFLPSGLLQKSSLLNQKSSFTVKFSPSSSLEVTFVLIRSRAEAFCTVHPGLASIFNITTALHAFLPPFSFIFMQILRLSTEISRLLWFSLVAKSLGKKFISSRVPKLLRFGAAIFPVPRARSQIRQRRRDSGLLATVTLNDTYHAAT